MNQLHLGTVAHLRGNPFRQSNCLEIIEDGALWVGGDGRILAVGSRTDLLPAIGSDTTVHSHDGAWLLPGLVDAHLHFPQYYTVAAANQGLLSWLEETIFPAESEFKNVGFANKAANQFVSHLLRTGVTTAAVFGSQFPDATMALFESAKHQGLRLISGLTLMDQGGPKALLNTPEAAKALSLQLMAYCRGEPLLHFALLPRFALACSPAMLTMCGELLKDNPGCYLQTHINESLEEIAAVKKLHPKSKHYLDVYDHYGLLGPNTLLIHNIHARDDELRRIAETGSAVCHCPSSNLFLGSGLFPFKRHLDADIAMALGTDVGAGLHFSVWEEAAEAYKVQQLRQYHLSPGQLLYLMTLGGARALGLGDETGNFEAGKSADFFVLQPQKSDYLTQRLNRCPDLASQLFVLMQLTNFCCIVGTYVRGVVRG